MAKRSSQFERGLAKGRCGRRGCVSSEFAFHRASQWDSHFPLPPNKNLKTRHARPPVFGADAYRLQSRSYEAIGAPSDRTSNEFTRNDQQRQSEFAASGVARTPAHHPPLISSAGTFLVCWESAFSRSSPRRATSSRARGRIARRDFGEAERTSTWPCLDRVKEIRSNLLSSQAGSRMKGLHLRAPSVKVKSRRAPLAKDGLVASSQPLPSPSPLSPAGSRTSYR